VVDQQVNVATIIAPFAPTEVTFNQFGAATTITRIDMAPVKGGLPNEEFYDITIGSSGAPGLPPVSVHHRSLRFTPDPAIKHSVPTFFTGCVDDLTAKLNAFVRLNYNEDIDLDVFYSHAGAPGIVTWDAYFWVVELPPGTLETPLINTPNDFAYMKAIQLRNSDEKRSYLIMALALP